MLQVFQNYKTGQLSVDQVPVPSLMPGGILVRNRASVISAGTERTTVATAQKSLLGKAQSRPDLVRKTIAVAKREGLLSTFRMVQNKLDSTVPLGYSCAGEIIAVAADVDEFAVGDRVACAGQGYASHAEVVFVPKNLAVRIPETVQFESAAFTTIGAIAMQGVRQSETVIGESVAVIGLGLIGLLTVQILKAAGCRVFGYDVSQDAVQAALSVGCDKAAVISTNVDALTDHFTSGYGFDASILTASTTTNEPLVLAGNITRAQGRVVIVGAVPANVPRSPFYEKEIDVRFSRSYGPGRYDSSYEERGLDYPFGYVRWTENRNMHSFLELLSHGKIRLEEIASHRFPIEEAGNAYDIITGKTPAERRPIGILLEYGNQVENVDEPLQMSSLAPVAGDVLKVGFVGAGNFAQNYLLPHLKKIKTVQLSSVATSRGITSASVAKKFKFASATTNADQILSDPEIDCVFIATKHDQHAELTARAIENGKSVYVEKPLALNADQLNFVVDAYRKNQNRVMVGFNRRFSQSVVGAKTFLARKIQPCNAVYRVNAGFVPKDHWTQDPVLGGGRVLGEVCHFVDLLNHLIDSTPVRLFAEVISTTQTDVTSRDNLSITLKYRDGSVATLLYTAAGDRSFPKERIELFFEQSVLTIDDFRYWTCTRAGKTRRYGKSKQDKGHRAAMNSFIEACRSGLPSPVPFEDAVIATITTFKILESITAGQPVNFDIDNKQGALTSLSSIYSSILAGRYQSPSSSPHDLDP